MNKFLPAILNTKESKELERAVARELDRIDNNLVGMEDIISKYSKDKEDEDTEGDDGGGSS